MNSQQQTFFEHVEEFRKRFWVVLIAVFVCFVGCFVYADSLLKFLLMPMVGHFGPVYFFSPAEAFMAKLKAAFLCGVILSSPVILGELWFFVSPALHAHEKKFVLPILFICSFLFLFGAVFAFYSVIPLTLEFFIAQQSDLLVPMISVSKYMDFLTGMLLAFGISFNLPVFILALVFFKVIPAQMLQKYQRHAVVLILIVAAAVTPGPDIASQLFLAVPLFFLFEMSVVGAVVIEKIRVKK